MDIEFNGKPVNIKETVSTERKIDLVGLTVGRADILTLFAVS